MPTPAQEAAILKADQFTPDWERSLDETAIKWARLLAPPMPHDIDNVDESWLPYMAVYYNAIAFTDLLGDEFKRRSIKEGVYLNTWAGWPASVDRFARDAEFDYTFTYNTGGNPDRRISIDLYITPSAFSAQSASEYQDYVSRVVEQLLPVLLGLNAVHIAQQFDGDVRVNAGWIQRDFEVVD